MASLAEYCGIWPTAGGQQYYVQVLAAPRYRPLLSYLVGWALMTAEMSVSASCALNNADIIGSFVGIVYPDLVWKVSSIPVANFACALHVFIKGPNTMPS